jgi:ribosomal 50S subunit-associated protein YjgA (DUF615 family)
MKNRLPELIRKTSPSVEKNKAIKSFLFKYLKSVTPNKRSNEGTKKGLK